MAQSKTSTAKKNSTKTSSVPPQPVVKSYRREIWAVVFLFLSVFMFISIFNTDGALIAFFADLTKGLIGWGYWAFAPACLLVSIILFFHRNKRVVLRIISMLMLPLCVSCVAHLIF